MKTPLLILLCIPIIGFVSCQDNSRVDDLQREIEELKQNSSDLEANNAKEKAELARKAKEEKQTRLEEKFPANTYAVATQKRVYFHSKPDKATKLKSFIVSGQYCSVEKVRKGFGYISFVYKNKTTRGWLKLKYIEPYELQLEDYTNKLPSGYKLTDSNNEIGESCIGDYDGDGKNDLVTQLFNEYNETIIAVFISSNFERDRSYQWFNWIWSGNYFSLECRANIEIWGGMESQGIFQTLKLMYNPTQKIMKVKSYEDSENQNTFILESDKID